MAPGYIEFERPGSCEIGSMANHIERQFLPIPGHEASPVPDLPSLSVVL